MIFTFLTPTIKKSRVDPVSHNASKCRLGIFCSAIRYVAVLQKTKKIEKEMMKTCPEDTQELTNKEIGIAKWQVT